MVFARVRLVVDRRVVTERSTLFDTRLTARSRSGPVVVDMSLGMLGGRIAPFAAPELAMRTLLGGTKTPHSHRN